MSKKDLIKQVYQITFLTSGQALIFDKEGKQIGDLQKHFSSGQPNRKLLFDMAQNAEIFTIAKWREWGQELNREDFIKLLNLK